MTMTMTFNFNESLQMFLNHSTENNKVKIINCELGFHLHHDASFRIVQNKMQLFSTHYHLETRSIVNVPDAWKSKYPQ